METTKKREVIPKEKGSSEIAMNLGTKQSRLLEGDRITEQYSCMIRISELRSVKQNWMHSRSEEIRAIQPDTKAVSVKAKLIVES